MRLCILCDVVLSANEKPEHILLNALGGRKTTKSLICSRCNEGLGSGADNDLAESVKAIRNLGNFKAGDGDPPPRILGLKAQGITFNLLPGGIPVEHINQRLNIDRLGNTNVVHIRARDRKEFSSLIESAIKAQKLSEAAAEEFRTRFRLEGKRQFNPAPTTDFNFQFGAGESFRSMAKSCLLLWASIVDIDQSSKYQAIKRYILDGHVNDNSPPLIAIKTRAIPAAAEEFCALPNIIWVGSNDSGMVRGYFHLYGIIGWSILLCEAEAPPNLKIALFSDPENPAHWEYGLKAAERLEFKWIAESEEQIDQKNMARRMETMLGIFRRRSEDEMIDRVIREVILEMNLIGKILEPETMREFAGKIGMRIASSMLRFPFEESI